MFRLLRHHMTLWAAWILTATLLLHANPFVPFGRAEVVACLGSLVLALDPRVRRDHVLLLGIPAIALLASLDVAGLSIGRLLLAFVAFGGATLLGARAVDDQRELERIAGHLALGEDPERALERLRADIVREIGRARRHQRPFVVLSVAPHPRVLASEGAETEGRRMLAALAGSRWMLELRELLVDSLHLYARVAADFDRVLCLVPEIGHDEIAPLEKRLAATAEEQLGIAIAIGTARFPDDALQVGDLIAAADDARRTPRLMPVRPPSAEADASPEAGRAEPLAGEREAASASPGAGSSPEAKDA